ncbi:pyridine nucleotide-disulfide oxidoreductase domain-containing protein 1-like isoform X2 [Uloborus diversus]|uniref:pyridine nucleotide-disulfide oxidoreductase domain-containing protein 1-like isoform X2 n=1 Tax=Uloborus diversus TaxID=327109 RepID=UPI00240A1207|nr:pyridine nucleotide-disulfide oxidoreductase domain-containing protein 1-like isoform X2 [Uloborus diversus]
MADNFEDSSSISATFAIIGGGIAGISCAEQLATEDPSSDIILVSASPLIKAVKNLKKLSERLDDFDVAEESSTTLQNRFPNCKVITAFAVEIKAEKHKVILSNGTTVLYKALCICSGAVPKVIYENSQHVIGLRDIETIKIFQEKISDAKRVLVVGNGGIAIELVYEIENCQVIWAIKDKCVGATFFDAGAAHFFLPCLKETKQEDDVPCKRMKYNLEGDSLAEPGMGSALGPDWSDKVNMKGKQRDSRNVHVEYECEVKALYERNEFIKSGLKENFSVSSESTETWPAYVKLTNGVVLGCDFVVSATGVVPNTDALKFDMEILKAEDGGLMVNDQMQTSLKDIYAAGDVCTASWSLSEHWFQMRLWTQARQMGAYAGKSMLSNLQGQKILTDICFDLFTHVTKFFGYKNILCEGQVCQSSRRQ